MDKSGRSINVHLGSDFKRRWISYCDHVDSHVIEKHTDMVSSAIRASLER